MSRHYQGALVTCRDNALGSLYHFFLIVIEEQVSLAKALFCLRIIELVRVVNYGNFFSRQGKSWSCGVIVAGVYQVVFEFFCLFYYESAKIEITAKAFFIAVLRGARLTYRRFFVVCVYYKNFVLLAQRFVRTAESSLFFKLKIRYHQNSHKRFLLSIVSAIKHPSVFIYDLVVIYL